MTQTKCMHCSICHLEGETETAIQRESGSQLPLWEDTVMLTKTAGPRCSILAAVCCKSQSQSPRPTAILVAPDCSIRT